MCPADFAPPPLRRSVQLSVRRAVVSSVRAFGSCCAQDYTSVAGSNFNPEQRRNPGAPGTFEIEDQMGTQKFALYKPLSGKETVINK